MQSTKSNISEYLLSKPRQLRQEIFNYPSVCLVVFRDIPELAQHYVLRILYVEQVLPQAVVATWVTKPHTEDHKQAVEALTSLGILVESSMPGGLPGWILNDRFRHNLKVALLGGGREWTRSSGLQPDPKKRTISDLDQYALDRWEAILHFMSQRSIQNDCVSKETAIALVEAGLLIVDERGGRSTITKEGFQFLLMDTASQVWHFLLRYLENVGEKSRGMKLSDCLEFLCILSLSTLGNDYSNDGLTEPMLLFLQFLREIGLVYQRTRKAGRFSPTRLAINITSRNRHVALETDKHKTSFLIVETNYRVYAFTDSEIQLALVAMFTKFMFRLPNLVVGVITRDSVRQAFRNGISAKQIITFLRIHAHKEMISSANGADSVPPSVLDQIKLWELERDRLTFTKGSLYNQFLSQNDYELVRNYAAEINVLVHSNDQKRTVVVTKEGHDEVRRFWKKHSKESK